MQPDDGTLDGFRRVDRSGWLALGEPAGELPGDPALGPLLTYLALRRGHLGALRDADAAFLRHEPAGGPFVVGVVGPVAVGKSTLAAALGALLRVASGAEVEVVSTDGFLLPNAELAARGVLERKGYPDSYDWAALTRFLHDVRSGRADVTAPLYSHEAYDVVADAVQEVGRPDVLVIEGLNLLERPPEPGHVEPSDLLDLALYVHADEALLQAWFVERFMRLRAEAEADDGAAGSFFSMFAAMSEEEARSTADAVWSGINLPNVRDHIAPTRARADVVLVKGPDHVVDEVHLRLP